ncbi:hypothetical protein C5Y96_03010 [Blastopirellula marina]|uniref:Tyr recombinase domain-containing protein n=1 Tax=Blastopirellula marina TaxID=124 RepID=A0A2S8G321_9BACT|nr:MULTISPECIES: tyrosine-type recombinase/integrase [Pirellulaceae]PQO38856.1 hypothetical protein C5Y96_03010 [Blastopirellula marina]RCS55164.1 hypothetical protein DTL36_03015 [Bremerella cremea]
MTEKHVEKKRILVGDRVTLVQRGKKRIWQMDFYYNGHRILTTKTRNLKIARKKALVVEAQLIQGTFGSNIQENRIVRTDLADAIKQFMEYRVTEGNRPGTIARYSSILDRFSDFASKARVQRVDQVTVPLFDRYRSMRKPVISGHSLWQESRLLKDFLHWCFTRGYIETSLLANEKFHVPNVKKKSVLALEQVNLILGSATPSRQTMFSVLALIGIRSGELRNLLTEDVDLENGWIYIVSRKGRETKTGQDWKVPIHPRLRDVLLRYQPNKTGWYFTAMASEKYPDGNHHIDPDDLNDDFKATLRRVGIPDGQKSGGFTLHSLRHFFKSHAIAQGVPREYVDDWQGHTPNYKVASDAYVHVQDDDSQRWIRRIDFSEIEDVPTARNNRANQIPSNKNGLNAKRTMTHGDSS